MKKILITMLLFSFSSQVAFADIKPMSQAPVGTNSYNGTNFTNDRYLLDLQSQIDELNKRNDELAVKVFKLQNPIPTSVSVAQPSPNDASQTVRIDNLEKRVGLVETALNGLKTALNKTLELLTKLLSLIK